MAEGRQQLTLLFVDSVSTAAMDRRLDVVAFASAIAASIDAILRIVVVANPTEEEPAIVGIDKLELFDGEVQIGQFPTDSVNDYWLVTTLDAAQQVSQACEAGQARLNRVLYVLDGMQPGFYPWSGPANREGDATLAASNRLAEEFELVAKARALQLTELQRAMSRLRRRLPESQQDSFNRLRRKAAEYDRFRNRKVIRIAAATTRPLEKVLSWAKSRRGPTA
jgi:hypothetical protein